MTEQQQVACAELARRMGWREGSASGVWFSPAGSLELCVYDDPPDYFNDPVASRGLVLRLAKNAEVRTKRQFICLLHPGLSNACVFANAPIDEDMILEAMTAEPSVIARAACKALGIEVGE